VTEAQCNDPTYTFGYDRTYYTARGVRWVQKATTKAECDSYGTKCVGTPRASPLPSTFADITLNASFPCDNEQKVFTWTPGKWLPGQPRSVDATPVTVSYLRQATPGFRSTTPPIFDIRKLFSISQQQSLNHFLLIIRSETFCRIAEKKRITGNYIQCVSFATLFVEKNIVLPKML